MAPNPTDDLVSLDEYLAYGGRNKDSDKTNVQRLELLITSASQLFQGLAGGRKFVHAEDIFYFDGHATSRLFIRYTPIDSGETVTLEYWNGTAWTEAAAATHPREIDYIDGKITLTSTVFHRAMWRVTYTGGYVLASIPTFVKDAVCQLVHRAEMRADGREGVGSVSMNDQSTSYDLKDMVTGSIKSAATQAIRIATR